MECSPVIVLTRQPYAEQGTLVSAYSLGHGYVSLVTHSARGRGAKMRFQSILHPLAICTLRYTLPRNSDSLGRLVDIEHAEPLLQLTGDMTRCAISLLLAELLDRLLRDIGSSEELYEFFQTHVYLLNDPGSRTGLFPQGFALQLARHLGYAPEGEYSATTPQFDLRMGTFVPPGTTVPGILLPPLSEAFSTLAALGTNAPSYTCPKPLRGELMRQILLYLQIHTGIGMDLKSLPILKSLFE